MNVVKIKPSHPSQGDYVLINEEDFDSKVHVLYEEKPKTRQSVKTEVKTEPKE